MTAGVTQHIIGETQRAMESQCVRELNKDTKKQSNGGTDRHRRSFLRSGVISLPGVQVVVFF